MRQLSSDTTSLDKIHPVIKELPKKLDIRGAALNFRKCQEILLTLVDSYVSTTIVIDALDECNRDLRGELMDCLELLLKPGARLKLFVSSRPDGDISRRFQSQPLIQLQATDNENDVARYVQDQLSKRREWARLDLAFREEVKNRLHSGSKGMFQWVALQVQQLLRVRTWAKRNIRERLDHLPLDLKHAYDEIWAQLDDASPFERAVALRAFRWVMCSFAPLNHFQLSFVVLIDPETEDEDDLDESLDENEIRDICGNLLTFNKAAHRWEFSHLSVREYLEINHFNAAEANGFVTKACLKYLLTLSHAQNPDPPYDDDYVIRRALEHVAREDCIQSRDHTQIKDMLKRFLGSWKTGSQTFLCWRRKWPMTNLPAEIRPYLDLPVCSTLAYFGITNLVSDWWEDPEADLDFCFSSKSDTGVSLLYLAVLNHRERLWRFLLEKKVDLEKGHQLPLHAAVKYSDWEAFNALIEAGANVNSVEKRTGRTALMTAAAKAEQGTRFARRLLESCADINQQTVQGDALLTAASEYSGEQMALLLLKEGAESLFKRRIMLQAIMSLKNDLLEACIRKGWSADRNDEHSSLLIEATSWHNEVAAEMLLEAGAKVNKVVGGSFGTAIAAAANLFEKGDQSVIFELLLEHGADINATNGSTTALLETVLATHPPSCQSPSRAFYRVLEAGADVNQIIHSPNRRDPMHRDLPKTFPPTPLCHAASCSNVGAVRALLERGADPNLGVGRSTPLYEAVASPKAVGLAVSAKELFHGDWGQLAMIEALLEHGADARAWSGDGIGNLLAAAALHRQPSVCELFLDRGFFLVNQPMAGGFPNALCAAVAGQRLWAETKIYRRRHAIQARAVWHKHKRPDGEKMWLSMFQDTERLPRIVEILLEKGAILPMPLYSSLASMPFHIPAKPSSFWALETVRGFLPAEESPQFRFLPLDWFRVLWHIETQQRPRLPLGLQLRQYGLPGDLPRLLDLAVRFSLRREVPLSQHRVLFVVWQIRGDCSTIRAWKHKRSLCSW